MIWTTFFINSTPHRKSVHLLVGDEGPAPLAADALLPRTLRGALAATAGKNKKHLSI